MLLQFAFIFYNLQIFCQSLKRKGQQRLKKASGQTMMKMV